MSTSHEDIEMLLELRPLLKDAKLCRDDAKVLELVSKRKRCADSFWTRRIFEREVYILIHRRDDTKHTEVIVYAIKGGYDSLTCIDHKNEWWLLCHVTTHTDVKTDHIKQSWAEFTNGSKVWVPSEWRPKNCPPTITEKIKGLLIDSGMCKGEYGLEWWMSYQRYQRPLHKGEPWESAPEGAILLRQMVGKDNRGTVSYFAVPPCIDTFRNRPHNDWYLVRLVTYHGNPSRYLSEDLYEYDSSVRMWLPA